MGRPEASGPSRLSESAPPGILWPVNKNILLAALLAASLPVSSIAASGKAMAAFNAGRYSNPALDENSPARKAIDGAGWEVGYDGMEVRL